MRSLPTPPSSDPATEAKWPSKSFAVSVFPAPETPLMRMLWSSWPSSNALKQWEDVTVHRQRATSSQRLIDYGGMPKSGVRRMKNPSTNVDTVRHDIVDRPTGKLSVSARKILLIAPSLYASHCNNQDFWGYNLCRSDHVLFLSWPGLF